jgi:hypothetical protein
MTVCLCGRPAAPAQTAQTLGAVQRIYVEPFAAKPGAEALRAELIAELIAISGKSHRIAVVKSPSEADAVLGGTGESWIRGYYSLNPRVRSTADAHPIYGGYLSVELKGRQSETLWSYLVTPRRSGPEDIDRNLASQMVRRLVEALK